MRVFITACPSFNMKLIIRRYQVFVIIILILLSVNINIISQETVIIFHPEHVKSVYRAALTFDDGPYPGYTEKLLEILDYENIKATFFLVGKRIAEYPELARLICSKGHEIGNHTYNHLNLTRLSRDEIFSELNTTREIIRQSCNFDTELARPPGGQINARTKNIMREAGYKTVMWTILPGDHIPGKPVTDIVAKVTANVNNNDIILMHMGQEHTLKALPVIIKQLKLKKIEFVKVSELEH